MVDGSGHLLAESQHGKCCVKKIWRKKIYGNQSKRNILSRLFLLKIKWVALRDADLFWSVGLEACFNWKKQILMFIRNSGIYNAEVE